MFEGIDNRQSTPAVLKRSVNAIYFHFLSSDVLVFSLSLSLSDKHLT